MSSVDHASESTGRPIQDPVMPRRPRRWPAVLLGVGGVLVAVGWQLAGPVRASAPALEPRQVSRAVRVAPVEAGTLARTHRYFGVTRAARRADLALTVGGRLMERGVEVGQAVEQGQRLARIDVKPLRHAVAAARARVAEIDAALAQARRDVARADALVARRAATAEEAEQRRAAVDRLRANRKAALAQLAEARRQYKEGGLTAPFAGVVTAVHFEVGELVPTGRPVVSLAGAGGLEVEVEVPESVIPGVEIGQPVDVELPLRGGAVKGTVERLGREALGPGRLFPVIVRLPADARLSSGMTAIARLETRPEPALLVPLNAILDPAGGAPRVFRLRPRPADPDARPSPARWMAERVPVEPGQLGADGRVAVRASGEFAVEPLAAGDQVVVGGHFALLDGDLVRRAEGGAE